MPISGETQGEQQYVLHAPRTHKHTIVALIIIIIIIEYSPVEHSLSLSLSVPIHTHPLSLFKGLVIGGYLGFFALSDPSWGETRAVKPSLLGMWFSDAP